jgi:hypothetical protein
MIIEILEITLKLILVFLILISIFVKVDDNDIKEFDKSKEKRRNNKILDFYKYNGRYERFFPHDISFHRFIKEFEKIYNISFDDFIIKYHNIYFGNSFNKEDTLNNIKDFEKLIYSSFYSYMLGQKNIDVLLYIRKSKLQKIMNKI